MTGKPLPDADTSVLDFLASSLPASKFPSQGYSDVAQDEQREEKVMSEYGGLNCSANSMGGEISTIQDMF